MNKVLLIAILVILLYANNSINKELDALQQQINYTQYLLEGIK